MKYYYVFLLFLAVSLVSCKKSTTGPNDTSADFRVHIQVTNNNHQPVSGLRVSMWNALFNTGLAKTTTSASINLITSATSISFALAKTSNISLVVTELNNKPYATLLTGMRNAGVYAVNASFPTSWGTHVYKCQLSVTDTTSDTLRYSDSIYLVLYQPDPEIAVMGYTSSSGIYETTDSLCFPNLFSLPPMIRTVNSPDSIATFSIPDSVQICLTDTSSGLSQMYGTVINGGDNTISLVWNPASLSTIQIKTNSMIIASPLTTPISPTPTFTTKLHQNYPNPFN
jgi:hypothetical protein